MEENIVEKELVIIKKKVLEKKKFRGFYLGIDECVIVQSAITIAHKIILRDDLLHL
jgi:hypothetical protein